jgi:hypothetical protein
MKKSFKIVCIVLLVVVALGITWTWKIVAQTKTQAKYDATKVGASYKEVAALLGGPTSEIQTNQIVEGEWESSGGVIAITFANEKISHKLLFLGRKMSEITGSPDWKKIKVNKERRN